MNTHIINPKWIGSPIGMHISGFARLDLLARAAAEGKERKPAPVITGAKDGVATMRIAGVLGKDSSWETDSEYDRIAEAALALAADPRIHSVFVDVDSPGGFTLGMIEAIGAMETLAGVKNVLAYSDQFMASAAYGAVIPASIVASESSLTGSIGTFACVLNLSGMLEKFGAKAEVFTNTGGDLKAAGFPLLPMSETHRAHLQESIDKTYEQFSAAVDKHRGQMAEGTKRGQAFLGREALQRGVIDAVGSRADAMALLLSLPH